MALLLTFLLAVSVPGSLDIDPALSWYTLETEHFAVHFPCRGRPAGSGRLLAEEVAAVAEAVHRELTADAGWTPGARTSIVVADFFDYANGWAAPLPENTITIIPTPPAGDRTDYDDWLRTLIAHEYAHVIQLDMARGSMAVLRRIFGRVVLPNALLPVWAIEGYALGYESRLTGCGRPAGSEYAMMIRAAADSGRLLPIDRCGTYELRQYPAGDAPYLYGGLFTRYVADRLGDGVWDDFSRRHAGWVPYCYGRGVRRSFGATFNSLWHEWQRSEEVRAESVARRVAAEPVTAFRPLTREGFRTGSPCWSRDGSRVYYLSRTGTAYPAIRTRRADGSSDRVLHEGRVNGSLALSRDGRYLAFAEARVQDGCYEYNDIFSLDLARGKLHRLTRGGRARDPDFAPDSTLVFVSNHDGINDLMLLDLASGRVDNLTENSERVAYHCPRFSPSGRYIAVGVHRAGGRGDIEMFDRRTGWFIPVTQDRANDLSPCWDVTGRYLYFVSDRSGIYNLYAYSSATGRLYRCTNARYGLFEPSLSPDNRQAALVTYGPGGSDVSLVDIKAEPWQPAQAGIDSAPARASPPGVPNSTLYYYNPFPSVLPRLWAPYVNCADDWEVGALTLGWDVLQYHRYVAAAGYRLDPSRGDSPFFSARYRLARFRPVLDLTADLDAHHRQLDARVGFPLRSTRRVSDLGLGVSAEHDSSSGVRFDLGWATSTAIEYRFGVAPASGTVVAFYSDLETRTVAGRRNRLRAFQRICLYIVTGSTSRSLRARLDVGVSTGDASADSSWTLAAGRGEIGVRGYSAESGPFRTVVLPGIELGLPLAWVERGIGPLPIFLENVNTTCFVEGGLGAHRLLPTVDELEHPRLGVGGEIGVDLVIAYLLPVTVTAGAAVGVLSGPDMGFYLGIESGLVAGLFDRFEPAELLRVIPERRSHF